MDEQNNNLLGTVIASFNKYMNQTTKSDIYKTSMSKYIINQYVQIALQNFSQKVPKGTFGESLDFIKTSNIDLKIILSIWQDFDECLPDTFLRYRSEMVQFLEKEENISKCFFDRGLDLLYAYLLKERTFITKERHHPLVELINSAIGVEQAITAKRFGEKFTSEQNCYATIYDEIQEALQKANALESLIKMENLSTPILESMRNSAINLSLEAIQIASACEIAMRGYVQNDPPPQGEISK